MTIYAAGALCWRVLLDEPQVLVIHRRAHKDISFPKGKVDGNEILPATAVREVREETGFDIILGPHLGTTQYTVPSGSDKLVHYWAAKVSNSDARRALGAFHPNSEVSEIFWMSFPEARRRLTYTYDIGILDRLEAIIADGTAESFPVIVQRHAKAMSRSHWGKSEHTRPLTSRGNAQAAALVPAMSCWQPRVILSSPWERCMITVTPWSKASGIPIATRDKLTEASYLDRPEKTVGLVLHHIGKRRPVIICSHRPVLPGIVAALIEATDGDKAAEVEQVNSLDPGSFAVIQLSPTTDENRFTTASVELWSPIPEYE